MTRFTRDTAFSETLQKYIIPNMEIKMRMIVTVTTAADHRSNPSKIAVTTNMAMMQMLRLLMVS